jgi:hypothetical protein
MEKFKIKYSFDNGQTWNILGTVAGSTVRHYSWHIKPYTKNKKKALVKVSGYNASNVKVGTDVSDAPFTIEVVRLISPNGGGNALVSGNTYTITWDTPGLTKSDVASVKLLLTTDGGSTWNVIDTVTGNPGIYDTGSPCRQDKEAVQG